MRGRPPQDLKVVLDALKAGATVGPTYRGHSFAIMRSWLDLKLTDRRVAPRLTVAVQYKIPPELARRIRRTAVRSRRTASQLVTEALARAFPREG